RRSHHRPSGGGVPCDDHRRPAQSIAAGGRLRQSRPSTRGGGIPMTSPPEQPSLANERHRRRESFRHGYIPPKQLVIDPSIIFDHDAQRDLDVVNYEVIRSKLWNLNV